MAYSHLQRRPLPSPQRAPPSPASRSEYTSPHSPPQSSPLRHGSSASTSTAASSSFASIVFDQSSLPSRTSTLSSAASSTYYPSSKFSSSGAQSVLDVSTGQKRDRTSAGMPSPFQSHRSGGDLDPATGYKSARQSLRPLPQPPSEQPASHAYDSHGFRKDLKGAEGLRRSGSLRGTDYMPSAAPVHTRMHGSPPSRTRHHNDRPTLDHLRPPPPYPHQPRELPKLDRQAQQPQGLQYRPTPPRASVRETPYQASSPVTSPQSAILPSSELSELQKSSTGYLRTLSKLAQEDATGDLALSPQAPAVVGLSGRRQLKRADSVRANPGARSRVALNTTEPSRAGGLGFGDRNWMDTQRQFLQAYEYLCHIGEAKQWIEDVIRQNLPPIVELEEALRDGVTLAEVVQALSPGRTIRIFRSPRLQFRHSDNIAIFFRFLNEVELPDLFQFELIDLYEKKNIPKVIYCIHALSWLLYRQGRVAFRIGNLVGQLQFEHHELEEVQKGLDRSGVSMPSFHGMGASFGAEPEPEPIESEDERIARELKEHEHNIIALQAQMRGCNVRIRLGQIMQHLWDAEPLLTELQARVRADWSRQVASYRLNMHRFAIQLQSATRAYITRKRQLRTESIWRRYGPKVVQLQSIIRSHRVRADAKTIRMQARYHDPGIRSFQAAVRGALCRKQVDDQYEEAHHAQTHIAVVQAKIRGMLQRQHFQRQAASLRHAGRMITVLQAAARGRIERLGVQSQRSALQGQTGLFRALQAVARGSVQRDLQHTFQIDLAANRSTVVNIQALSRGCQIRTDIGHTLEELEHSTPDVRRAQAALRGWAHRRLRRDERQALQRCEPGIVCLEGFCRGFTQRRAHQRTLAELSQHIPEVTGLQALARAMILRLEIGDILNQLEAVETNVEALQAAARGQIVRIRFAEKQAFFRENMQKVVKAQSFVRAKLQGQAYKSLTVGKNPPVGTVKNFVHLLNDSDFDFDEEVEFEQMRKTVVQHVRENEMADQYIAQLDIKIALLVKNKITLDEVVKHQRHFGGSVGTLLAHNDMAQAKDPFDLKALNRTSRQKLEKYQELFVLLQTQPQYLARLFKRLREMACPDKEGERIKHLTMGLFGYAQKRREEYYLLRLLGRSIKEEIEGCASLADYLRGTFFWARIFGGYIKTPRDRKFLRDLVGPILKEHIVDNRALDLESDPMNIYVAAIQNEQLRTGQRSRRPLDIGREEAIRDPETKQAFIAHLQDLRDLADAVLAALEDLLFRMPYGIRFIAQQTMHCLRARFPHEDAGALLHVAGHWMWRAYLHPALAEPEKLGVIDRALVPEEKKNLAEVTKVLSQVASGRLFGAENVFLQPLNSYITESIGRLRAIWSHMIDVPEADEQFDIDEYNDLYAKTKPTLYIKMADIFSIHQLIASNIQAVCAAQDDGLRDIVRELGSAQGNQSEMRGVGSSEICLTLNPKLLDVEDPDAEIKALFMETKRCILYIIRVQTGANLLDIMVKPITPDDERRWADLVQAELAPTATQRQRGAYADANMHLDLATLGYAELKSAALENILQLEAAGRLSRHNRYQDLLNALAIDIRTKHRRRVARAREMDGTRSTLARLQEQTAHLDAQLKTYNDYIEQAMTTLHKGKKGRRRFVVPFTKQWDHERELARSGRVPRFGSYKYSAADLASRGVLISWQGGGAGQGSLSGPHASSALAAGRGAWAGLDVTVSSNEVGVFVVEGSSGSIAIPGASGVISLDALLQKQWNGETWLECWGQGERIRLGVAGFLALVMRKFYRDGDS